MPPALFVFQVSLPSPPDNLETWRRAGVEMPLPQPIGARGADAAASGPLILPRRAAMPTHRASGASWNHHQNEGSSPYVVVSAPRRRPAMRPRCRSGQSIRARRRGTADGDRDRHEDARGSSWPKRTSLSLDARVGSLFPQKSSGC